MYFAFLLGSVLQSQAQQPVPGTAASQLSFEVASIRPCEPGGFSHFVRLGFEADAYNATNVTLELLLEEAYGVDDRQIVAAPAWVRSQEFDIEARIDNTVSERLRTMTDKDRVLAQRDMLQALIAERFGLLLHKETRELPIYSLIVSKHGSKLKAAAPGNTYANGAEWPGGEPGGPQFVDYRFYAGDVRITGQGASLNRLVDRLTQKSAALHLERKIVDNTRLTGNYDFELHFRAQWHSDAQQGAPLPNSETETHDVSAAQSDTGDVSIFTALQEQLGLKLEPTKGPVEVLIIDEVKEPSEN